MYLLSFKKKIPNRDMALIFNNFFSLFIYRKARRKERDDAAQGDTKLYLEESVLELLKFTPADLRSLVDMPAGLDYNEWLASYSKYQRQLPKFIN